MTVEAATDFDAAFAEFSTPDDKKPADAAPAAAAEDKKPADAGGEDGAADGSSSDNDSGDPGADSGTDAGAGDDSGDKPADAAEAPEKVDEARAKPDEPVKADEKSADADEVLNRLAKIVNDTKPKSEEKPAAAEAPADEAKPLYSQEEEEFLTGYDKDWGDVVRGESLKRRGEYKELLEYIFTEVGRFVAPLRDQTTVLAERTHLSDIKSNVPDYNDDLRDRVVAWAKTQPEYLQPAYDQVIQYGTADEVKDLVERYRKDTGQAAPAAAAAPTGKDNELSSEAKKAAAALAPVESKRSGVQQPGDPASFEDAWKQFASTD